MTAGDPFQPNIRGSQKPPDKTNLMNSNPSSTPLTNEQLRKRAAAFVSDLERFMDANHHVLEAGIDYDASDDTQSLFERETLRVKVNLSFPLLGEAERLLIFMAADCAQSLKLLQSFKSLLKSEFDDSSVRESYREAIDRLYAAGVIGALKPLQRAVLEEHTVAVKG